MKENPTYEKLISELQYCNGGHGKGKDGIVGSINHKSNTGGNPNHEVNVYFPDCELGLPNSKNAIQSFWGDKATIYAHEYKTIEQGDNGVTGFLVNVNNGGRVPISSLFKMLDPSPSSQYNTYGSPSPLDRLLNLFK
jgi:hypothetical protein